MRLSGRTTPEGPTCGSSSEPSVEPADVRLTVDGRRGLDAHVAALGETRLPLGDEGWHLVTIDGPRGVRVVAYALS